MRLRAEIVEDTDECRELYEHFMPGDVWCGNDHTFWRLVDEKGRVKAACSAVCRPEKGYVYLSSAGVDPDVRQKGLHRRMIQLRCRWGKRQGATHAVTYTLLKNYPSMMNLVRGGFRFADQPRGWLGVLGDVHYFEKEL